MDSGIDVKCPECGSPMLLKETTRWRTRDGQPRKFYGCSRYPGCKGTHGAHQDGTPLGKPADKETKEMRIKAHQVFDSLWKGRDARMYRKEAYNFMRQVMKMTKEEAHIANFDISQCKQLIEEIKKRGYTK